MGVRSILRKHSITSFLVTSCFSRSFASIFVDILTGTEAESLPQRKENVYTNDIQPINALFNGLVTVSMNQTRYEYMAVGVRHNILCEEILRNASYLTIIYIWKDAKLFIDGVRDRVNSNSFCEAFEWLIERWKKTGYDGVLPPIKSE